MQDTTVANADLWRRYFEDQWRPWMGDRSGAPSPVAQVADGTAARVAGFLTLVASGPIAWLYNSNAAAVRDADESLVASRSS